MGRERKKGNKDLPPNLYPDRNKKPGHVYYRYRRPDNRKFVGIGYDKDEAINLAHELNRELTKSTLDLLKGRLKVQDEVLAEDLVDRFKKHSIAEGLSENTLRQRKSTLKPFLVRFSGMVASELKTKHIAELLNDYIFDGKKRMAQSIRSNLLSMFDYAITQGLTEFNIVAPTKVKDVDVNRARLSLEDFNAILKETESHDPWLANAMLLALVTGQRRADIAVMQFSQVKDGFLWVRQQKTNKAKKKLPSLIKIPLKLRLDAIGMSVEEVIARCRDNVISKNMIHHTHNYCTVKRGGAVHMDTISRQFGLARERAIEEIGLEWINETESRGGPQQ